MRVPVSLSEAFKEPFDALLAQFAAEQGWIPDAQSLTSERFLNRSVIPHILKLSDLFNRIEKDETPEVEEEDEPQGRKPRARKARQEKSLEPYWNESSNPANLRLAYFTYFMPANLYRVAAVWSELSRLGFEWKGGDVLKGIEFGAGPATGACGIAAGERHAPCKLPPTGNWALIEQDRALLDAGTKWAPRFFESQGFPEWGTRPFCRKIDPREGFLPRTAPSFGLWVMSYFLNESSVSPAEMAQALVTSWERHLEDEGVAILVEPALKLQSRRLLEIRAELLKLVARGKAPWLKVLLPCLGHQACGALAGHTGQDDWCHEEVMWWRPPSSRRIDALAGLDRKSLPFSYLVVTKSGRSLDEILPGVAGYTPEERYRLVSPSHKEGRDREFFVCGQEGKRRARFRPEGDAHEDAEIGRGTLLLGAELKGDTQASRVQTVKKIG